MLSVLLGVIEWGWSVASSAIFSVKGSDSGATSYSFVTLNALWLRLSIYKVEY